MFAPNARLSIYDIIKPPAGWNVDALLACTYSASLDTILSLPAAIQSEAAGSGVAGIFTAADLASLKRICGSTLIFCQRGAIHPADMITPAVIEVESMVHEVELSRRGSHISAFHPKLWLIRFTEPERARSMLRLAVLSRNLTGDRSWDVGAVLESRPAAPGRRGGGEPGELGEFLRALPGLCCRKLATGQMRMVASLADQAERSKWLLPEGVRSMRFHALGIGGRSWKQPPSDRMILLSPFLTSGAIKTLAKDCAEPIALISRRDALDRVWPTASARFPGRKILAPPVDPARSESAGQLHGKAILWESRQRRHVAFGSMNATGPAIGGANVEVMVSFDCTAALGEAGLEALLAMNSLGSVLEDYEPDDPSAAPPEPHDDRPARAALYRTKPWLECVPCDQGWRIALRCESADPTLATLLPGLRFRPATLPGAVAAQCFPGLLGPDRSAPFQATLELAQITGFVVLEAGGGETATAFTLNLEVRGVSEDERRTAALRALLPTERSFIDFMRILLGDFASLEAPSPTGLPGSGGSRPARATGFGPGLLELLLRCAVDEPQRLREIEETLKALDPDELSDVAPEAFRELWVALTAVTGKGR